MKQYRYRAINSKGRQIKGVISAVNEANLHQQLQTVSLELVQCSEVKEKRAAIFGGGVKVRDLIQLFMHLEQLQSAGVPLLDSLADIRDTTDNNKLRDILSDIYRTVSEGGALSESMAQHPKIFHNLYVSLVKAGEDTGDLSFAFTQLIKYLKWVDELQTKVRKATRYPMILMVVVLLVVVVMMGLVVPQIVGFIKNMDMDVPFYTAALIATSEFFQVYWWATILGPIILYIIYKILYRSSDNFQYQMDVIFLNMPIAGPLIRKISVARYSQTFGSLFSSGIDILGCLASARKTVTNRALLEALDLVEEKVKAGSPLSESFNASGEFPSMVVRMIKIGEESGNLSPVLEQVSEFYTKDVDEAVEGLVTMIEPALTGIMGLLIMWIAVSVFGPIYSSFENIDI
jgi:type IV pilus assembly protein PilC